MTSVSGLFFIMDNGLLLVDFFILDNGLLLVDFFIMDNDFGLWTKEASDKWTKKFNPALSQLGNPRVPTRETLYRVYRMGTRAWTSTDAVHIHWGCCPNSLRTLHTGKEGFPTLAYNVTGKSLNIHTDNDVEHYQ